ncbi:hypothetical protein [Micromonospora sp. DT31]|uniref:hypothetical protein n=1 Tax=Micromonospora sp. DT31 TaxID=3393434 RepID=UPI003CE7CD15
MPGPGGYGPPAPVRKKSKRWLWITLSSLMAVVLLCVGGAFGLRHYNLQRSAERSAAFDEKHYPVKPALVDRMMAEHTRALKDRDLKAFLAPFDPADKKLVADRTRVFQNLTKIPFSEAKFTYLAMPKVTPLGSGYTFDLMVSFVHRFGAFDQAPIERRYFWKVVQGEKNGPLKVTAIDRFPAGFKASDDRFYPTPWDTWKSLHVEKTAHTLLIVEGSLAAEARRHAAAVEAAAVRNREAWKAAGMAGDPPAGFVVSLVRGKKALGSLWHIPDKPSTEEGFSIGLRSIEYDADSKRFDGPPIGGSRVVVDVASDLVTRTADGPATIFRHELAHSMMRAVIATREADAEETDLTKWVVEGFAEHIGLSPAPWTASERVPAARKQRRAEGGNVSLPSNRIWAMGGASGGNYHYLLGHAAVNHLAQRYGEQKMFQFVAEHYRGKTVKNLIPQVFGISYEEFEREWAAQVTRTLR